MGIPIILPGPFGSDCAACDSVLWESGETPLWLKATFSGIEKCSAGPVDPPNGSWILTQIALTPCIWQFLAFDWRIQYDISSGVTKMFAMYWNGSKWFIYFYDQKSLCAVAGNADYTACGPSNIGGKNGTVIIELI